MWTKSAKIYQKLFEFLIFFPIYLLNKIFAEMWKQSILVFSINEGCGKSKRRGRRGNRSHKVRIQCLYPRGNSWAGRAAGGVKQRRKKKHKKQAVNSYLPTLEEVESCADVGDPVDPLQLLALLTWLEGKRWTMEMGEKQRGEEHR